MTTLLGLLGMQKDFNAAGLMVAKTVFLQRLSAVNLCDLTVYMLLSSLQCMQPASLHIMQLCILWSAFIPPDTHRLNSIRCSQCYCERAANCALWTFQKFVSLCKSDAPAFDQAALLTLQQHAIAVLACVATGSELCLN